MPGIGENWPDFMPVVTLVIEVSSGSLSLGSSAVENYTDFDWGPDQLFASLWKNGTKATNLSISSSTGAVTLGSAVGVSDDDEIEVRFDFVGKVSNPWGTRVIGRRACYMTVSGDSTTTFDEDDNPIPVPTWDLTFGFDANDRLKVGVRVTDDDGATQDMTVKTRLWGLPQAKETSTTVDLSSTSVQTHTADFYDRELELAAEIRFILANGVGTTKVEDTIRLLLFDATLLSAYDTGFPTTGILVNVTKPSGTWAAKLDEA